MSQFIRLIALSALIATCLFWLTKGAPTGWTKRYVSTTHIDPVTEIEYPVEEPKFVPGVDFLGGALAIVAVIYGISFIFKPSRRRRIIEPAPLTPFEPEEIRSETEPDENQLEPEPEETLSETELDDASSDPEPKEHS